MGTGRTLNKHPRTRPIKSQGEKRRRSKAQRARLVKLGMDEAVVSKMQPEDVRKLVQQPTKVQKLLAPKAPKAAKPKAAAKTAEAAPAEAAPKKTVKAAKAAAPKAAKPKAAAKKPAKKAE